jgi:hypothetical protein
MKSGRVFSARDWSGRDREKIFCRSLQAHDRRAPSAERRRRVREGRDVLARLQQPPHRRALDALPAAVGEAHLADPAARALVEVLGHHGDHVAGREGVEVELAVDGEDERLVVPARAAVAVAVRGQCVIRTWNDPALSPR